MLSLDIKYMMFFGVIVHEIDLSGEKTVL